MAKVELKGIAKVYEGNVRAVDNANIVVEDKEFVVFVGPSGCGKSTTLRMVAGLEDITEGELYIDGELMNDVPPKDRNIAMVFQNYALYPHMSVYDNMAFGLKIKKVPKDEIDRRVKDAARILDIEKFLDRKPKALSGGQRQRVAVGRAIVRSPKVFLFDEPLSNLDAKLRVSMRAEISKLHHDLNATMIYVTHDQVEAMTMANKIVVMKDGKVQQIGAPMYLYNHPCNKFVAGFIGSPPMNFVQVKVEVKGDQVMLREEGFTLKAAAEHAPYLKAYDGKDVFFGIRPEHVSIVPEKGEDPMNLKVSVVEPLGAETNVYVNTSKESLVFRISGQHDYHVGDTVPLYPEMDQARYFDKDTELSILAELDAKAL
ncbi:MAG: sn-glycerol-3-phosphate ABC transporter ATP-binding protein UgpC [Spirochaetaceae bacterium]|jgi:multiple sugar transport system ATP-binding protein|nr:sn-glycerol-3-phosphate ABC transporter ATP-binding protein UgpC [Spirochaetaceae bacterium]